MTLTGNHVSGTPETIEERTAEIPAIHAKMFPPVPSRSGNGTYVPVSIDDAELLAKARVANDGGKFARLFEGDTSGYESHSEADLAFCSKAAFWTGCDAERIDRWYRTSGLARDKWDEQHGVNTYGDRTIARAIELCSEIYTPAVSQTRPTNGNGQRSTTESQARKLAPLKDDPAAMAEVVEQAVAETDHALRWHTARDIAAMTPEHTEWIIEGLAAAGGLTELASKVKAGKTRLILDAMRAVLTGQPFLGLRTRHVPVVYLTEERAPTLRAALERADLLDCTDLHILLRQDVGALNWPEVVTATVQRAEEVGAGLLAIDTLSDWAEISGDGENSAGEALAAVRPLQAAAATGLAVWMNRHDRKSGGELGDSARGSSAFSGAADIVLSLRRANTAGHESRRDLLGVGRFDEVPGQLVLDLDKGHYVSLGDSPSPWNEPRPRPTSWIACRDQTRRG